MYVGSICRTMFSYTYTILRIRTKPQTQLSCAVENGPTEKSVVSNRSSMSPCSWHAAAVQMTLLESRVVSTNSTALGAACWLVGSETTRRTLGLAGLRGLPESSAMVMVARTMHQDQNGNACLKFKVRQSGPSSAQYNKSRTPGTKKSLGGDQVYL